MKIFSRDTFNQIYFLPLPVEEMARLNEDRVGDEGDYHINVHSETIEFSLIRLSWYKQHKCYNHNTEYNR